MLHDQHDREIRYLWAVSENFSDVLRLCRKHTNSPSRARAGSRVGCASRCLSTASKTRMNLCSFSKSRWRCAVRTPRFSHLPSCARCSPALLSRSISDRTAATVFSNKCRPVMHSRHRIIACLSLLASRYDCTIALFPVARGPWNTIVEGRGVSGCSIQRQSVAVGAVLLTDSKA